MSDKFETAYDFAKSLGDEFTTVLADGLGSGEYDGFIDTGCYMLNAIMSGSIFGGMPNNKTCCIAGPSDTGKTFFSLSILKHYLESTSGAIAVLFETEGSTSRDSAISRGIDPKRIVLSEPDTVEKFRNNAVKMIDMKRQSKKAPPMMFVLDSLGQLSTEKEMTDAKDGKNTKDMTRAQLIKGAFRTIRLNIGKARVPFLIINHTYDDVGGNAHQQKISGGSGAIYASDLILTLTAAQDVDGDRNRIGSIVTVTAYKSRVTRRGSKVRVLLNHENGLSKYWGLLDLVDEMELWPYVPNKYETPHGKFFGKQIYREPERFFTQDVLEKIDEYAKRKFLYGNSYEATKDNAEFDEESTQEESVTNE